MPISIEDHVNDPDAFLQKALQSKVDALNARINDLVSSGKNKAELERLLQARADFMEVLRSPRLYLARPPGAAAPGAATPGAATPGAASPATGGMSARAGGLPPGAIPQPRRVGAVEPAAPSAGTSPRPAHPAPAAAPKPGGMLSFLKGVQAHAPAESGAPAPVAPTPATQAAGAPPAKATVAPPPGPQPAPATPSAKPGGMLSFLKGVQAHAPADASSPPAPAPAPSPSAPSPAAAGPSAGTTAGEPPSKGQMLSFLEQIQGAATAPAAASSAGPKSRELTYENKKALIEMIKRRAATTGFQDIYEMLNYKREKLVEHRANLLKTSNLPAHQVTALIDREIAEIDALLMKRPQEILPQVQEFDEVASVDTGGLAAIRRELKGLLDEIK